MIGELLTVAEFFTQLSDFLADKWAEILAVCGGTAGITAIATILYKIISTAISSRILKKNNVPINATIQALQKQIETTEQELQNIKIVLDQMPAQFSEKFTQSFNQYNETKKKVLNSIANGVEATVTPEIEQVEQTVEQIKESVTKC